MYASADLVLPALWDEVAGEPDADWAVRDEHGKALDFSPEFARLWRWKDELPEQRLAIAGKHLGRYALLAAPRLAGALWALRRDEGELGGVEREIVAAVDEHGPASAPELRLLLGTTDRKGVERAVGSLHRRLLLTNAGRFEQEAGWPAIRSDLFERRWREHLRRVPGESEARLELARCVLHGAGEVSAADTRAALGWKLREARDALDELADAGDAAVREEDGIRLWAPSRAGRGARRAAR